MEDLLHQNYATVSGSPTLLSGTAAALTDGNAALRLSGTATWVVPDSASDSLTVADGVSGGAAISGWVSVPTVAAGTILGKSGSYELKLTSGGKLTWLVTGAAPGTVTSASTLSTNTWYHVAAVYNGDYTGTTIFGDQSTGSSFLAVSPDYVAGSTTGFNNLHVCKYTIQEKGQLTSLVMDLEQHDSVYPQNVSAVVYEDDGGEPGALLAQSDPQTLSTKPRAWVTFPLSCQVFPGDVWLGFAGGAIYGSDTSAMRIGCETSGGTHRARNSVVSVSGDVANETESQSAADPFGTAALSDSKQLSIYANYTATGRTGAEGKILIYLNGAEDASTAYTRGVADTSNNLQHPAGLAVDLDDWAIWNKKLTPLQVATHYNAR